MNPAARTVTRARTGQGDAGRVAARPGTGTGAPGRRPGTRRRRWRPVSARAGNLQDQHHHDHRAGEQTAEDAGDAGQGVHLGIFCAQPAPPGQPAAGAGAHGGQHLLRADARAANQRHRRDGHGPRHQSRVEVLGSQVVEQAGNLPGQPGQPPQQASHDAGRRGGRHPPPVPAEPAGAEIGAPAVPELDYPQGNQPGEGAEHPEGGRVTNEHPELPLPGDRGSRRQPEHSVHERDASKIEPATLAVDTAIHRRCPHSEAAVPWNLLSSHSRGEQNAHLRAPSGRHNAYPCRR